MSEDLKKKLKIAGITIFGGMAATMVMWILILAIVLLVILFFSTFAMMAFGPEYGDLFVDFLNNIKDEPEVMLAHRILSGILGFAGAYLLGSMRYYPPPTDEELVRLKAALAGKGFAEEMADDMIETTDAEDIKKLLKSLE